MATTQYKHKFIHLECVILAETLKKNKIKMALPSSDNWEKNLKSILSRIPKKFKFIAKMNDSNWLLTINDITIDRNDPTAFGELLLSIPPPIVIKIIKNIQQNKKSANHDIDIDATNNHLIIEYISKTFQWVPPNPKSEDEDEWDNNYESLLTLIHQKYKLKEDNYELMDKDECEISCGDDLMSVWQFLVDDNDTFISKISIINEEDDDEHDEDAEDESVDLSFDETESKQSDINAATDDIIDDMSQTELKTLKLTVTSSNEAPPIDILNYIDKTNDFYTPMKLNVTKNKSKPNMNTLSKPMNKFFVRTQSMRTVRVGSTPKSIEKVREEEEKKEEMAKTPGMTLQTQFQFGLMDIAEDEEEEEMNDSVNVKKLLANLSFEGKTIKHKLIELGSIIGLLEEHKKKQSFRELNGILNKIKSNDNQDDILNNKFERLLGEMTKNEDVKYVESIFKFFKLLTYDIKNEKKKYGKNEIKLKGKPSAPVLDEITSNFYHLSNAISKPRPNIYEQLKIIIPTNGSVVVHDSGINCKDFIIFTLPQIVMENQQTSLVDKCILDPVFLQRFINFLMPSAAKYNCKEIFFEKLKKIKISTVGLFGSREEVLNMLRKYNSISNQLFNALINDDENTYYLQPGIHAILPVNLHKNDNIKNWNHVIYLFYLSLKNSFRMNAMKVKFMRKDPSCLLTRVLYEISCSVLIPVSSKELEDFGVMEVEQRNKNQAQSGGGGARRRQKLNFKLEETKSNHIMCSDKHKETKRLQIITKANDGENWKKFEMGDKIDCYSDSGWFIAKIKKIKRNKENKDMIESIYIHYPGWGSEYDEWIALDDAYCDCKDVCLKDQHLIAPPNTQTRHQKSLNDPDADQENDNDIINRDMDSDASDTFLIGGNNLSGFINLYGQPQRDGTEEIYQSFKSKQELFDFLSALHENNMIKWNHTFSGSNGIKLLSECIAPAAFHNFNIAIKEIEAKQDLETEPSKIKKEADKVLLARNREILFEFHDFYTEEKFCKESHDEIKKIITLLGDKLDANNREALQYIYLETDEIFDTSLSNIQQMQYSSWRDIILERMKNDLNVLITDYNQKILDIEKENKEEIELRKQQNETIDTWFALYTESLREYKQDVYGYSSILNIKSIKVDLETEIREVYKKEKQIIIYNLEDKLKETQQDKTKSSDMAVITLSKFMYQEKYGQYDISYLTPITIAPSYYMQFVSIDLPAFTDEIRTNIMRNMQYEIARSDKIIFNEMMKNGDSIMFIQSDDYEKKRSETKIIVSSSRTLTFDSKPLIVLKKDRVHLVAYCSSQKLFAILFAGGVLAFCIFQDGGRISFTNKMSELHDLRWYDEDLQFKALLIQEINKNVFVYLIDENNICRAYDYDANSWDTAKRFTLDQAYNVYLVPPTGSFLLGIKPQYEYIDDINMILNELDLDDMDASDIDKLSTIQRAQRQLITDDLSLTALNAEELVEIENGFKASFAFKDLSGNDWVLVAIINKQAEIINICIVESDDEFENQQTLDIPYKYWIRLYSKIKDVESLTNVKYPTGRIQIHAFLMSEKKKLEYKVTYKSCTGYEMQLQDSKQEDDGFQLEFFVDNALLPETFLLTNVDLKRIKIQQVKKDQIVVCTIDNECQLLYHLLDISVSEARMKIKREAKKTAVRKITKLDYMEYMVEKFGSRAAVFFPEDAILAFHTTYLMQDDDSFNAKHLCDQVAAKICTSLEQKEKKNFAFLNWKCNVLNHEDSQSIASVLRAIKNKPIALTGADFVKNVIIQLPIQIARGANNKFQLMYNGADDQMKYIKAGDPYQLCKEIRFGAYDGLIKSWEGKIKIVTSMGKQSTGKSYMLNHLFGTKFDISGGRCTDGSWLSARFIEDILFILCDFEGLGSFERSPQEDMLLATFNSAVSNCTIFKCDNRFDRTVEDMFNKFQSGVKIMSGSQLCFQGELLLVIKDVVETGAEAAVHDFNRHIERLAQESDVIMNERGVKESTFFVNQMYKNGLSLIPYPPLANKAFFKELNETLQPAFDDIEVLHEGGKQFLSHVKLIMAKLHIGDWSAMSGEQAKIRATEIRTNLQNAVEAGAIIQPKNTEYGVTFEVDDDQNLLLLDGNKVIRVNLQNEVLNKIKKYKEVIDEYSEIDAKIEEKVIRIVAKLNDAGLMLGKNESLQFLWEQFNIKIKRRHDNFKQMANLYQLFLDIILIRRKVRVNRYITDNTKKFEDKNEVDSLVQASESRLNVIRDCMKLCGAKCNECFYLCLLSKNHEDFEDEPDDHSCNQSQHLCTESCTYCHDDGKQLICGDRCGHSGKHNCRKENHTCGLECGLSQYGGCQIKCNLASGHNQSQTPCKCAAETHYCPQKCAIKMCKNTCQIAYNTTHDTHICIQSYCPYKCQVQTYNDSIGAITDCGRPCSCDDHEHELKMQKGECKDEGHSCNREHRCPHSCNEQGNCIVSIQRKIVEKQVFLSGAGSKIEYDSFAEVNGGKRRCCKKIPVGTFSHVGDLHKCFSKAASENIHTCDVSCDSCGYFCQLKYGHYEESGTFHDCVHGNMRNTRFYSSKDTVDTGDGRTYKVGDVGVAEMCNIFCQRQGRGHVHLEYCQYNLLGKQCFNQEGRRHQTQPYKPDEEKEKDEVKHSKFWRRKKWKDPCLDKFKAEFELCPFVCQHISHKEKKEEEKQEVDGYEDDEEKLLKCCTGKLWHKPAMDHGGHMFRCKHPFSNAHVVFVCDVNDSMRNNDNSHSVPTLSFITNNNHKNTALNNRLGSLYESIYKFIKCRIELKCRDKCSAVIFSEKSTIAADHIEINLDFVKNYLLKYKPGHFNENKAKALQNLIPRLQSTGSVGAAKSNPELSVVVTPPSKVDFGSRAKSDPVTSMPSKVGFVPPKKVTDLPKMVVGQRVKLPNGKTGIVRYVGTPTAANEELVGFELDTASVNAGDGSIRGEKIFASRKGRGYFVKLSALSNLIRGRIMVGGYAKLTNLLRVSQFNGKTVQIVAYVEKKARWKVKLISGQKHLGVKKDNLIPILDWEPMQNGNVNVKRLKVAPKIGDRVKTADGKYGVVKYVGTLKIKSEAKNIKYIGLELEDWDPNGHNGKFKKKQYFKVSSKGSGYFVTLKDLTENLGSGQSVHVGTSKDNVALGKTIKLKNGYVGTVKYFGPTHFSEEQEMFGIALNEWSANANNGTVNDTKYFKAKANYGYFARKEEILMDEKENEEKEKKTDSNAMAVNIGDNVSTVSGYDGIVRFEGKVHFNKKNDVMVGIELNNWSPNGNDGIIDGHKYFECKPGFGYFLPSKYIMARTKVKVKQIARKHFSSLKVGDTVSLSRGQTGIVKYIGDTDFTKGEIIGLELDSWTPAGHDGTVRGKKYFDALAGRGYFTRRTSIGQVVETGDNININNLSIMDMVDHPGTASIRFALHELNESKNDESDMNEMVMPMMEMMRGKSDLTKIGGGTKQYLNAFENVEKLINFQEETVLILVVDDNDNAVDDNNGSCDIIKDLKSKMKDKLSFHCITLNGKTTGEIKRISEAGKGKLIDSIDGVELSTVCVSIAKDMNTMAQNMSAGAFI